MTIEIAKWMWEQFGDELKNKAKDVWGQFNWPKAELRYRDRLMKQHGVTRLLGFSKEIVFRDIYTDAFVIGAPMHSQWHTIEELQRIYMNSGEYYSTAERMRAEGLVVTQNRVLILGRPGSGKTTFLKHLILLACEDKISKTPIFIWLKEWADSGLSLRDFLITQFEICAFPDPDPFIEELFERGRALLIFDGLDEVAEENNARGEIMIEIRNLGFRYPDIQIFVSCRSAVTYHGFEHFFSYEMADFSDKQIDIFVRKWFQQTSSEVYTLFRDQFHKKENLRLRELAKTPLLLAFLCLYFEGTLDFPSHRVELYKEVIQVLLQKWDIRRGIKRKDPYGSLLDGRKEKMLARIALEGFRGGNYFMKQDFVAKQIELYLSGLPRSEVLSLDGSTLLKSIELQHGILVQRAHEIYSFLHLSLQEYLAARYIVDNPDKEVSKLIDSYLKDARWKEVMLFVTGLMDNADVFFEKFQRGLELFAGNNVFLAKLIRWSSGHAETLSPQIGQTRIIFISRALLEMFVNSVKNDLGKDYFYAQEISHALFRALVDVLPRKRVDVLDREILGSSKLRSVPFSIARDLAHALSHDVNLMIARALAQALALGLQVAPKKLNIGFVPEDWGHDWVYKSNDINLLIEYLAANQLLLDCLKIAVVTDRLGIANNLFSLPRK